MASDANTLERPIATVYPSIAATATGRALGVLYESIPLPVGRLKLSHLLFALPTSPIAALLYFWLKIVGPRYILRTHTLRSVQGLAMRPAGDVPIDEIGRIEVVSSFGQRFFHAGDLIVRDHMGTERLRLNGVVRPEMFRQTILDARDALIRTDAARRTIAGRHSRDAGAA